MDEMSSFNHGASIILHAPGGAPSIEVVRGQVFDGTPFWLTPLRGGRDLTKCEQSRASFALIRLRLEKNSPLVEAESYIVASAWLAFALQVRDMVLGHLDVAELRLRGATYRIRLTRGEGPGATEAEVGFEGQVIRFPVSDAVVFGLAAAFWKW